MFKKLRNKIENKRESKKNFWRLLVFVKDLVWRFISSVNDKIERGRWLKNKLWKFLILINDLICNLYYKINFYKYKKNKFPDIVIIGAQKSATLALWNNLNKHPDIKMVEGGCEGTIEVHFFDNNYRKGKLWYKSHFIKDGRLWGEKSPKYIYKTKCHKRMYETIPNAKLILCLRNPVRRAYSHWNMSVDRSRKDWSTSLFHNCTFEEAIEKFDGVVGRGFYIDQIKSLLKFYPREQVHILIFERLRKNMKKEHNKIWAFLGVKKFYSPSFGDKYNTRKYSKSMRKETEKRLYKLYEPYNKRLFDFLGYEIEEWKFKG